MMVRILTLLLAALCWLLPPALAAQEEQAALAHTSKRIALTFDDTPRHTGALFSDDERAIRLIAALDRGGVKQAAFFVNPGRIAKRRGAEARIAAYVAAGHVIANHTWSHPRLRETPVRSYIENIDAAQAWLEGRKGYRPWFRFPFLDEGGRDSAKRDAVRIALARRTLRNGYVTVDASDWFYDAEMMKAMRAGKSVDMDALTALFVESHVEAAAAYDEIARKALGRTPAHVLLLHEADLTVLALPALIDALNADGWTIITADEAYGDPLGDEFPDVPVSQGTLTEMIAWERGIPAPRWYKRNDTRIAGQLLRERALNDSTEPEE